MSNLDNRKKKQILINNEMLLHDEAEQFTLTSWTQKKKDFFFKLQGRPRSESHAILGPQHSKVWHSWWFLIYHLHLVVNGLSHTTVEIETGSDEPSGGMK